VPVICGDLLELPPGVTDGRPSQGRDHPVAAVLALAAAAVVAGSRSFTAIAGWAADVPAGVLEDLYRRCGAFVLWWPSAKGVWLICRQPPASGGEFRGAPDAEAGTGVA
jgi:DDE_Tnp_1-associated